MIRLIFIPLNTGERQVAVQWLVQVGKGDPAAQGNVGGVEGCGLGQVVKQDKRDDIAHVQHLEPAQMGYHKHIIYRYIYILYYIFYTICLLPGCH